MKGGTIVALVPWIEVEVLGNAHFLTSLVFWGVVVLVVGTEAASLRLCFPIPVGSLLSGASWLLFLATFLDLIGKPVCGYVSRGVSCEPGDGNLAVGGIACRPPVGLPPLGVTPCCREAPPLEPLMARTSDDWSSEYKLLMYSC